MNVAGHVQSTVTEFGGGTYIGSNNNNAQKPELSHPNFIWTQNLGISTEETNAWDENNPTVSKGVVFRRHSTGITWDKNAYYCKCWNQNQTRNKRISQISYSIASIG